MQTLDLREGRAETRPGKLPASAGRGPQPSPRTSIPSGTLWVPRGTTGLAHLSPSGALPCPDHPDPDPAAQLELRLGPRQLKSRVQVLNHWETPPAPSELFGTSFRAMQSLASDNKDDCEDCSQLVKIPD